MQPQQFVLLGTSSVERWSEQLDLSLDHDALNILTEDLNFRLRQLAHDASQHMRHSGRRRITPNDIDRALQWCNFGPSCGLGYRTSTEQTEYTQIDDMCVPIYKTIEVEHALDVRLELEVESVVPSCHSQWALIDGRAQCGVEVEYPEGQRKLDAFTSIHSEYLEQAVQAIVSETNEATAVIIDDFASNPNLSVLLPSLLNSINVGLHRYHHDTPKMFKLLGAFKALINNQYMLLTSSTSMQTCLQILYYCLYEPLTIEATKTTDELTFRMKAAYIMQYFIETNSNSINDLEEKVTVNCLEACLEAKVDAMFGALFTLRLLRKDRRVLKKLPQLIAVIEQLEQKPKSLSAAKACLARGFLQDMARRELLNGQAVLLSENRTVDYAAIEQYLGPTIGAMLYPLNIGEFIYQTKPFSQPTESTNNSDQLINSFFDDAPPMNDIKNRNLKMSTSILRSHLIRRPATSQNVRNVIDVFPDSVPLFPHRIQINYGQTIPVKRMNRINHVMTSNLAAVLSRFRVNPNKRVILRRHRRPWLTVMRSACIAVTL